MATTPVDTTYCASAAKRAGKRFFGTKIGTFCMGGGSLIRALKASARKGVCDQPCAASDPPERKCGGGWGNQAMSLYVLKTGKGEWLEVTCLLVAVARPDHMYGGTEIIGGQAVIMINVIFTIVVIVVVLFEV
jgi:hypothetical protein